MGSPKNNLSKFYRIEYSHPRQGEGIFRGVAYIRDESEKDRYVERMRRMGAKIIRVTEPQLEEVS